MSTERSALGRFLSLVPVESFAERYAADVTDSSYFGFPLDSALRAEEDLRSPGKRSVAYFSMEFGLSAAGYNTFYPDKKVPSLNVPPAHHIFSNLRAIDYYLSIRTGGRIDLPIYSGGLGVLAGDTLKSAADRGVSLAGVGILWNKGYFKQNFWFKDGQIPEETTWDPQNYPGLVPLSTRIAIPLRRETVHLRLWKYFVYSYDHKHAIPLILLDSHVPENSEFEQKLTDQLYRSDNAEWKILQRVILGIGGMRALEALGYSIDRYHLNEGHAALAFTEKMRSTGAKDAKELSEKFAYTCHTPVAAGHDRFQKKALEAVLPEAEYALLARYGQDPHTPELINFTEHAMNTSRHVNAVAQKHGEVTRLQFPQHAANIRAITNGVHTHTWVSAPFAKLFDAFPTFGDWRRDPERLVKSLGLKDDAKYRAALWAAHAENKKALAQVLKSWHIDPNVFTVCWARRIAGYKRPALILQDVHALVDIARRVGPIQIIFAGKAHPQDDIGATRVNEMLTAIDALEEHRDVLRVLMLENYDTTIGKMLASSVDVWLNNPLPPFEASGTSGMKAILNGVLQLSTLDGWVVEAAEKNIGWIFGWEHHGTEVGDEKNQRLTEDSRRLYEMLERVVKLYYQTAPGGTLDPSSDWLTKMAHAVSEAGFFSTGRMVSEYESKIWDGR